MSDDLVEMARLAQHDERMATGALYGDLADRIEELEARMSDYRIEAATKEEWAARALAAEERLAKAVEVAEKSIKWLRLYGADVHREATTLAELKGEK